MPRGGARAGAGRPKKMTAAVAKAPPAKTSKAAKPAAERAPAIPPDVQAEAEAEQLSPLEYMLKVMNDRNAQDDRRDRMALLAAPFVHGKAVEVAAGKKSQQAATAKERAVGKFAPPAPPGAARVN